MDPIEGYSSSTLMLSGNSTARARWDAKLGLMRPVPGQLAVCTFRSLLPDGGYVPAIDVVITRLYPIGFKGDFEEGKTQEVWDEREESQRAKEWEVRPASQKTAANPSRERTFA